MFIANVPLPEPKPLSYHQLPTFIRTPYVYHSCALTYLEIAVDDMSLVAIVDGVENLTESLARVGLRHSTALGYVV